MNHIRGMPKTSSTAGVRLSLSGFVLAGGQSRRMGRDKAIMMWNDKTLLDHMIQLLLTAAGPVRVVGRGELPDRLPGNGPLGGILTALEVTETHRNLILGTDLPLLTSNFLNSFGYRVVASEQDVVACNIGGMYPL